MSYYDDINFSEKIIYSIQNGLFLLFVIMIFSRYLVKKKKETLYLTFSNLCLSIVSLNTLFLFFTNGQTFDTTFNPIFIIFFPLAMLFLFAFAKSVLFFPKDHHKIWIILYYLIGCIITGLTFFFLKDQVLFLGFPLFWLGTFYGISIQALRISKHIEDPIFRIGIRIMGIGPMIAAIVDYLKLLIADYKSNEYFNFYIYIILLIILSFGSLATVFCYYLGWIMPNWFKFYLERRIEQKKKQINKKKWIKIDAKYNSDKN